MSKGEKGLWDIAIEQANITDGDESKGEEKSVLFMGSRNAGKTSMILRFLDRDEPSKPTAALEYTFGRRAKGHNMAKDVGHIWELGGGTWLSHLMDSPLNPGNIRNISVAIVLDLSKPNELWFTLEKLLTAAKARVEAAVNEARAYDTSIKDDLKRAAWERLGESHEDKGMIEPFLVPLVIIGAKFDLYQDFESEKRKVISRTLRFVAHSHGAHLQFFSTKHEALVKRMRNLISHLLFKTEASKKSEIDHNKPLVVPPGLDSLQQIGTPPLPEGDLGRVTARNPMELWKTAYTGHFPQENISDPSQVDDPAKDPQYAEPAIDSLRAQKDEVFEVPSSNNPCPVSEGGHEVADWNVLPDYQMAKNISFRGS